MKLFNSKAVSLMSVLMVLSVHFNTQANPLNQFAPQALKAAQVIGKTALVTSPLWVPGLMGYRYGKKQTLLGYEEKASNREILFKNKAKSARTFAKDELRAYRDTVVDDSLLIAFFPPYSAFVALFGIGYVIPRAAGGFLSSIPLYAYGKGCERGLAKGKAIISTFQKNRSMQQKEVCNVIS